MKKRILLIVLAIALVLTVFACGAKDDAPPDSSESAPVVETPPAGTENDETPPADTDNAETPPESPAQPDSTVLTGTPGVLVMATNAAFPPYEFYDEGDKIVGIDAEIAEKIAEKLGLTLRIDDMDFNAIISAVSSGKADMGMAGMTVTEERLQNVDFSTSYATGVQAIIVPEGSAITSVDDLFAEGASTNIGVQEATTGDLYTTWDLEDEGLATISRYKRGGDAVLALLTGKVDCVVIDNEPAKAFVAANEGLVILDTEYAVEDYAISFAKGNTALVTAVDTALRKLIDDGTVQSIIDKYIPAE